MHNLSGMDDWLILDKGSPESKVHGANIGPTWVLPAPDGPHVGLMNRAIRECLIQCYYFLNIGIWSFYKITVAEYLIYNNNCLNNKNTARTNWSPRSESSVNSIITGSWNCLSLAGFQSITITKSEPLSFALEGTNTPQWIFNVNIYFRSRKVLMKIPFILTQVYKTMASSKGTFFG